ncbi:hypothetical protein K492DRAFT_233025 [Lichtheimia hyalospora FSU 10163]|nr:hypothetical protein K492DRAFT_233025 [Lichtheimia hyalospora FSU 10163]
MENQNPLPPVARDAAGNKIEMRPYYGDKDLNYVHYLVYSTDFDLVPRGVRRLLQSPVVMSVWLAIFASVYTWVPPYLVNLIGAEQLLLYIRIAVVIGSVGGGLLSLFWWVDKQAHARIQEALLHDLKDPGEYYRKDNGNFWLLTVQDQPVACIGIDHHQDNVYSAAHAPKENLADSEAIRQAKWPRVAYGLARIDDTIRGWVTKQHHDENDKKVIFKAHKPNEATLRRLAVKSNLQGKGLSTPLLKRVAFWAHAQQIEYLYAETNEHQTTMADILSKRHGYNLVSTTRVGLTGEKRLWRLDVKLWMSKELEARDQRNLEKEMQEEKEELKGYSY